MTRRLATIRKIGKIQPIEKADNIVLAKVDGWHVIVKKNEFKEGDLAIYVEIDSVLPPEPRFEFLKSKNYRIKTLKMKGVISQGICFPMSFLPSGTFKEGDEVTELLGIKQYSPDMDDPPVKKKESLWEKIKAFFGFGIYNNGKYKFPSHLVSKTDQERIQNCKWALYAMRREAFPHVSEKLDGMSATYLLEKKSFGRYVFSVCSRNYGLKEDNSAYWEIARKYDIKEILKKYIDYYEVEWVCIQGEIIGEKIQGNKYHIKGIDFYVFNIIDNELGMINAHKYRGILSFIGGNLKQVPVLNFADYNVNTVDEILEKANGESALYPTPREGIVVRCDAEGFSFKAISNEFLLKHKL